MALGAGVAFLTPGSENRPRGIKRVSDRPSNSKRWLILAVKFLVVGLVVWAVRGTLLDGYRQLDEHQWHLDAWWLVAAGVLYLLGLLPAALFWHHVLKVLGQSATLADTLRAYYIGHLGKYVPGKAMVVVIRTALIRGSRVDTAVAAVSVFYETLTMMASGAFIAAAILAVWFRSHQYLLLMSLGLMAVAGLPTLPPVFRRLVRLAGVGKSSPETSENVEKLGAGALLVGWAAMTVGWVTLGLSLWAVLSAMGMPCLDFFEQLARYTASVALAMVAGFLSLVPGGAGVRELILAELMIPHFEQIAPQSPAEAAALVSAVVLRLVWLASELLISGVLWLGKLRTSRS